MDFGRTSNKRGLGSPKARFFCRGEEKSQVDFEPLPLRKQILRVLGRSEVANSPPENHNLVTPAQTSLHPIDAKGPAQHASEEVAPTRGD
jgi:hypothetical protein